jgi:hypothetical protein
MVIGLVISMTTSILTEADRGLGETAEDELIRRRLSPKLEDILA